MSNCCKLSIVYEARDGLDESLASLFTQDFKDFEVLVIGEQKYKYDNLHHLILPNLLLRHSILNHAMKKAKGEYVTFSHAEVISDNHRYYEQIEKLDENKDLAAVGSNVFIGKNNDVKHYPESPKDCHDSFLFRKENFLYDYATIFKKEHFWKVGGFSSNLKNCTGCIKNALFLHLWCRFFVAGYHVENIQKELVRVSDLNENSELEKEKSFIWGALRRKTLTIEDCTPQKENKNLFEML